MFTQPNFSGSSPAQPNGMPGAMPFPTSMPGQAQGVPGQGMPQQGFAGFGAPASNGFGGIPNGQQQQNGFGAPANNGFAGQMPQNNFGGLPGNPAINTVVKGFENHTTEFLTKNVLPVLSQGAAAKGCQFSVDEMIRMLGMTPVQSFSGMNFGAAPKTSNAKVSQQWLGQGYCNHRYGARSANVGQYCSEQAVSGYQVCKTHNKGNKTAQMGMFQGGVAPGFSGGIPGVMPNVPGYGQQMQQGQMQGYGQQMQMPGQMQQGYGQMPGQGQMGMNGMMPGQVQQQAAPAPQQQMQAKKLNADGSQVLELSRGLFIVTDAQGHQVMGKVTDISNPNPGALIPLTHDDVQFAARNGLNRIHQTGLPQGQAQGQVQQFGQAPAQGQQFGQAPAQIPGLPTQAPVQIPGLPQQAQPQGFAPTQAPDQAQQQQGFPQAQVQQGFPQAQQQQFAQAPAQQAQIPGLPTPSQTQVQIPGLPQQAPAQGFPQAQVQIPGLPQQAPTQAQAQTQGFPPQAQQTQAFAPVAVPTAVAMPAPGTLPEIPAVQQTAVAAQ